MSAEFDVLLVEDEPVVREAAARILRPEGITVDRAEDVEGALGRLRRSRHRLVLSDLMLPGFSGFDLLERLAEERPELPVIVLTGYATIENALAAFKKGAFDFLPKPFDVPELLGLVRRALRAVELGVWRTRPPATGPWSDRERLFLGQHAWIAREAEGIVFGVAESWPGLLPAIRELRLPRPGDTLTQGLACAEIATADEAVHRIWAPVGGSVLEINRRLEADPDLLQREPFSGGWVARVAPSDLENELVALTRRPAAPASARRDDEKETSWSS